MSDVLIETKSMEFAVCRRADELCTQIERVLDVGEFEWRYESGEFCFFRFEPERKRLVFGRDVFGRKSLCWRWFSGTLEISVFPGGEMDGGVWRECYPGTVYVLTFKNAPIESKMEKNIFLSSVNYFDLTLKFEEENPSSVVEDFTLFSLYPSEALMVSATELFPFPPTNFVTLKSDIFTMVPGKEEEQNEPLETPETIPSKTDRTNSKNKGKEPCEEDPSSLNRYAREFISVFEQAVRQCLPPGEDGEPIPVLFSGGVDSLMVALTAAKVVDGRRPVLLYNVAFGEDTDKQFNAPDRLQAIEVFKFLRAQAANNGQLFRLFLVNVPKSELAECRAKHIAHAIAPCNTVLDDSIGCVLWFASRTKGVEYLGDENCEANAAPVEVKDDTPFALVGSGSDEQLGGYARFRTAFEQRGIYGVGQLLESELRGIGKRNLGRDDRVGTSNGKAILAPFLEESVVRFLNSVPVAPKTGFSLGPDNKLLLRTALAQLGVPWALCRAPKKAMQFGSRIAGLEQRGERGSAVCSRLTPTIPILKTLLPEGIGMVQEIAVAESS